MDAVLCADPADPDAAKVYMNKTESYTFLYRMPEFGILFFYGGFTLCPTSFLRKRSKRLSIQKCHLNGIFGRNSDEMITISPRKAHK